MSTAIQKMKLEAERYAVKSGILELDIKVVELMDAIERIKNEKEAREKKLLEIEEKLSLS